MSRMRWFLRAATILLVTALPSLTHLSASMGDVPVRYMRSLGFSGVSAEIRATGTVLGRRPTEILPLLLDDGPGGPIGFTAGQRDTLILEMVKHETNREHARAGEMLAMLYESIAAVEDWTALAEILERTAQHDLVTASPARSMALLTDLADRILASLEAPSAARAGYERAALALGSAAAALADEPGLDGRLHATVLAEQLRSIMRLSRDAPTVRALAEAARKLLAIERAPPEQGPAN